MTLKERFDKISCKDCDMPYCDIKCTILSERELNKLNQIADDYAIEFKEWSWNKYKYLKGKGWFQTSYELEMGLFSSTKELLEIFKKEKGL